MYYCNCSDKKTPKWRDCQLHKPKLIQDIQTYKIRESKYNSGRKLGDSLTQDKIDNATHLLVEDNIIIGTANYIKRPIPHAMYEAEDALQNDSFLNGEVSSEELS